jgi:23S rRNA (cytidine1920-2'-O)/16S rRNA (cytidine1409-2'-O)-methyltransferase
VRRGSGNRLALIDLLHRRDPPLDDPAAALAEFRVLVDGAIVTNPAARVRTDAAVVVRDRRQPQGVRKLGLALDRLGVAVEGRLGMDVGACTGGFTMALLLRGARRVVAVDVGYGQLLGSLQQDPRVVNLERTNVADLSPALVAAPDVLGGLPGVIVADVTKIPLRQVGLQLAEQGVPAAGADLVGLVKPMFELAVGVLPTAAADLDRAVSLAASGLADHGWAVLGTIESAVRGHGGAVEFFVHARWAGPSAESGPASPPLPYFQ